MSLYHTSANSFSIIPTTHPNTMHGISNPLLADMITTLQAIIFCNVASCFSFMHTFMACPPFYCLSSSFVSNLFRSDLIEPYGNFFLLFFCQAFKFYCFTISYDVISYCHCYHLKTLYVLLVVLVALFSYSWYNLPIKL